MKMLENLQDDFDFNYKTLKSAGGKNQTGHALKLVPGDEGFILIFFNVPCSCNLECVSSVVL